MNRSRSPSGRQGEQGTLAAALRSVSVNARPAARMYSPNAADDEDSGMKTTSEQEAPVMPAAHVSSPSVLGSVTAASWLQHFAEPRVWVVLPEGMCRLEDVDVSKQHPAVPTPLGRKAPPEWLCTGLVAYQQRWQSVRRTKTTDDYKRNRVTVGANC
jgi:hypothetical protein